jgi:hypothetical protein
MLLIQELSDRVPGNRVLWAAEAATDVFKVRDAFVTGRDLRLVNLGKHLLNEPRECGRHDAVCSELARDLLHVVHAGLLVYQSRYLLSVAKPFGSYFDNFRLRFFFGLGRGTTPTTV